MIHENKVHTLKPNLTCQALDARRNGYSLKVSGMWQFGLISNSHFVSESPSTSVANLSGFF